MELGFKRLKNSKTFRQTVFVIQQDVLHTPFEIVILLAETIEAAQIEQNIQNSCTFQSAHCNNKHSNLIIDLHANLL